ncbi:hypothetical protein V1264_013839 [Littorina saxatilis]|uniref:beta-mannosidase n=2 Tax=Littorina saxatilis TaxID=31220 RepID=A0AAN9GI97_9CAEN
MTSSIPADAVLKWYLDGHWTVSNAARNVSVPAKVPGSMYTALQDFNNRTENPLYRDNDVQLAWIGHANWTYTTVFECPALDASTSESVLLVAEGVDTVSTVVINGKDVGKTFDMFVRYSWDITDVIQPGDNTIEVRFESATGYAAKQAASYPYTVPRTCHPWVQHGECYRNFIRKEPCSFSWDWGPSFPTQGIWKPMYLVFFGQAMMDMATVEVLQGPGEKGWVLKTKAYFNVTGGGSINGQLKISLVNTDVQEVHDVTLSTEKTWAEFNISVPESAGVKRWWPNGYGDQALYDVIFEFTASDAGLTSLIKRIGFRTIELVQDPVSSEPSQGLTFYFKVNGLPIFMKGSNWIPADNFQERITKDRLRSLLQAAADAHINGMRVWGGGIYESDDFYDLTDELGILIWQDFMFASDLYPADEAFIGNVTQEVTYQVRRLMHRPSICLWSGNNENEGAIKDKMGWSNYTIYYNDYIKLYITTIMAIVTREHPSSVFVSSSPSNGVQTAQQGYVDKDPQSNNYGDVHFYSYDIDEWKPGKFPIPRFASEYGTQAWCNFETLLDVFEPSDMSYNSSQAVHRQHHPQGNQEMLKEISMHLKLPPGRTPDPQRFKHLIYLTQINQAMSIKTESEHYRRHQSSVLPDGRGLTMGALYWQLNDIWQAPTWASIDFSGRWKMLHNYALQFFSPLLVSPYQDGNDLDIFVVVDQIPTVEVRDPDTQQLRFEPTTKVKVGDDDVLDLASKVEKATTGVMTVEMYSWKSFTPLHTWTVDYKLNTTAESVFRQDVDSMMTEAGCTSSTDCFIHTFLNDRNQGVDNHFFLAELKDSNLEKAEIAITNLTRESEKELTITLSTTKIAPFVWLDAGWFIGKFSRNGFLMLTPTTTVTFTGTEALDLSELQKQLSVMSLMDVYD